MTALTARLGDRGPLLRTTLVDTWRTADAARVHAEVTRQPPACPG